MNLFLFKHINKIICYEINNLLYEKNQRHFLECLKIYFFERKEGEEQFRSSIHFFLQLTTFYMKY